MSRPYKIGEAKYLLAAGGYAPEQRGGEDKWVLNTRQLGWHTFAEEPLVEIELGTPNLYLGEIMIFPNNQRRWMKVRIIASGAEAKEQAGKMPAKDLLLAQRGLKWEF